MPRGGFSAALELLRSLVSLVAGTAMAYLGYRFFLYSIGYLAAEPPKVTAGLMAGLAGFTFTAAAVTLLRDWIIVERIKQGGKLSSS
ncbi:hypothetical protein Pyrde_0202 [Pyrodictium delaneyi]|uniref:Uncharacterized protein n=1 Tax=Pyrodictium delaneyi TaxID=1273541 RepID=A0A0P0N1Z4_9CREN|nr:hypothetical protein [Pyrodictium delaneyi]ALL00252.1 hypothetical protein Pyrde_0202 [Pyrodictium delaneyi]OWJ54333.1 hypothetical protein Pdsh_07565 [Pyrodictium delaneyi]